MRKDDAVSLLHKHIKNKNWAENFPGGLILESRDSIDLGKHFNFLSFLSKNIKNSY